MKLKYLKFACLTTGAILAGILQSHSAELHVAKNGNDSNPGTVAAPFRHIQKAADLAQPGDTVTVHEGVYRERVNPPRGGESEEKRIVYQAAPGEKVEIKGSEVAKGWEEVGNDTWKVTLPNSYFGSFNPYNDLLAGEWYIGKDFPRHSATVYIKGDWMDEAATLKEVLAPVGSKPLWKAEVTADQTTIWAQIRGVDPNQGDVEISARQSVFYPSKPGRNFITVRGFIMRNAATPWAGAMSEQVGLIGTHWSKGWIIEKNTISHSMCTGITLGRYEFPENTKPPTTAPGFVRSVELAVRDGWNRETIGSHIVRDNEISHCEKNAIHGSLGGIFSTIVGNSIHHISVRKWVYGEDTAAIKFLGSQGILIQGNHIYGNDWGIWLDWMAQGTRVSANLLHDNNQEMFLEANHGPCLIDNNLFLSSSKVETRSEGVAFVHNLFTGQFIAWLDHRRATPYFKPHSTEIVGLELVAAGDTSFFNNLFVGENRPLSSQEAMRETMTQQKRMAGWGIPMYEFWLTRPETGGNVYCFGAMPCPKEADFVLSPVDPAPKMERRGEEIYLHVNWAPSVVEHKPRVVTARQLGKAKVPNVGFEQVDGQPMDLSRDYFGRERSPQTTDSGPLATMKAGPSVVKVWPRPVPGER